MMNLGKISVNTDFIKCSYNAHNYMISFIQQILPFHWECKEIGLKEN